MGNRYAIEMHLRMPGSTTLFEAHTHSMELENRLKQHFGRNTHIAIHIEPVKVNGHYEAPCEKERVESKG
jgi:divalent metal cation (Fe/Co/Zn/Cd) transporter